MSRITSDVIDVLKNEQTRIEILSIDDKNPADLVQDIEDSKSFVSETLSDMDGNAGKIPVVNSTEDGYNYQELSDSTNLYVHDIEINIVEDGVTVDFAILSTVSTPANSLAGLVSLNDNAIEYGWATYQHKFSKYRPYPKQLQVLFDEDTEQYYYKSFELNQTTGVIQVYSSLGSKTITFGYDRVYKL